MCKCLLVSFLLICLTLTQIVCDLQVADPHDVSIILKDPSTRQVTSDLQTGQGRGAKNRQWQKRLLWTRKRSYSTEDILDSPDMQEWPHTGLPNFDYHMLSSPKNCCAGYSKTIQGAKDTKIRLVFLSVYLPGREMKIYEATTSATTTHPLYPRLVAESKANVLHITVNELDPNKELEIQEQEQELPGFMAVYWEVPNTLGVWRRIPYTQCPVAHAAIHGGDVKLTASGPVSADDFIYDCIWVIRIPTTGWAVYVRITEMDLRGLIEIRHGLHAVSPLLATNGNSSTLDSLLQPKIGFWGRVNGGIYVRVVKPINDGYLTFVYGIAKLPEGNECGFHYLGYFLMQGMNCEKPQMCIPSNHTCNGVNNCPYGQDEEDSSCKISTCKHAYEKQCWSGDCVHRVLEFCPEDQCPRDKPFRCDWFHKCYSQVDKCNGIHYCDDGKDERGCPKTSKGLSTKTIVIIVCVSGLFTILPSIILCCWDDPVERDLQRAQEAFTNLCDLYSGRTLLTQIQAARRAGTLGTEHDNRTANHRPLYPVNRGNTAQEEVILLAPPDPTENVNPNQLTTTTNTLIVPTTEIASPRLPPRTLPLTPPMTLRNDIITNDVTSPTRNSLGSRESQGSRGSRSSNHSSAAPMEVSPPPPDQGQVSTLSPPPYLLQPDVVALEHVLILEDDSDADPPPYLSPPGGATADGLPPDTEAPPPYESVQHMPPPAQPSQPQLPPGKENPPAYSH